MTSYVVRRVILTIPVLFLVTTALFVLIRVTPGDPILIQYGIEATPDQVEAIRADLGLDRPIVVQYFEWLGNMLSGDFGHSIRSGRPVTEEIWERLPATIEMQMLAFTLAVGVAVPLGAFAALKRRSPFASVTSSFTMAFIAIPGFFVSTMLVFFFTYKFRIFEQPRYVPLTQNPIENLRNLVLPVLALSLSAIAVYTRFVRASVLEALSQDYVRTARAKGLREWQVLTRHALRNALIPMITLFGLSVATLWTGAFITERIFNWPGVGRLATTALVNKDYPVVQTIVFMITISYVVANLLVDIVYAAADPRIRYDSRR
jgi:peptide/nickel transport system permease protein